jgi:murein DD-endopeptidase MepM/ murein hydrolase activator NlpD
MPVRTLQIALAASLMLGQGAAACEMAMAAAHAKEIALSTRKPVLGPDVRLVSGFGVRRHPILMVLKMHAGVDWAAPAGTPVVAAAGGRVTFAGVEGAYGKTVLVGDGGGWSTRYAHLSAIDVRAGDCIAALSRIGKVGATGVASGPLLHFEVIRDGTPIDPMQIPAAEQDR